MSSGNNRIVWNTFERALSQDLNRSEALIAAARQQTVRQQTSRMAMGDSVAHPGLVRPFDAVPAPNADPVVHDVFAGLMVRCDAPGYLLVDAGGIGFFNPAFAGLTSEDSPYIVADVPALALTTVLTFTANAGPGIRWDVVEMRLVDQIVENASRDIYNPATQTFTSVLVPKVRRAVAEYRIALGTPGGGLRAPDPGWCPLALVMVPTTATGFTQCDVYDVRPLASERAQLQVQPSRTSLVGIAGFCWAPQQAKYFGNEEDQLAGYWLSEFMGYRSGGEIRKNVATAGTGTFAVSTPGGGDGVFVLSDTQNASASAPPVIGTSGLFAVVALFPRGYPRWVRYSQAPLASSAGEALYESGRLPTGPRGLLVTTDGGQVLGNGICQPITPPTQTGLTNAEWGHIVDWYIRDTNGDFWAALGDTRSGGLRFLNSQFNTSGTNLWGSAKALAVGALGTTAQFTAALDNWVGTKEPAAATALLVRVRLVFGVAGIVAAKKLAVDFYVGEGVAGRPITNLHALGEVPIPVDFASQDFVLTTEFWIPLTALPTWDAGGGLTETLTAIARFSNPAGAGDSFVSSASGTVQLLGFKF